MGNEKMISDFLKRFKSSATKKEEKEPSSQQHSQQREEKKKQQEFDLFTTDELQITQPQKFSAMQKVMYITEAQLTTSISAIFGGLFEDYMGCSIKPVNSFNVDNSCTSPNVKCLLQFNYVTSRNRKKDTDKFYAVTEKDNNNSEVTAIKDETLRLLMETFGGNSKKNSRQVSTKLTEDAERILSCLKYRNLSWKDSCEDLQEQYNNNNPLYLGTTSTVFCKQVMVDPEKIIRFLFQATKYVPKDDDTLVESPTYKEYRRKKFYVRYYNTVNNAHIYMITVEDIDALDIVLRNATMGLQGRLIDRNGVFIADSSKEIYTLNGETIPGRYI